LSRRTSAVLVLVFDPGGRPRFLFLISSAIDLSTDSIFFFGIFTLRKSRASSMCISRAGSPSPAVGKEKAPAVETGAVLRTKSNDGYTHARGCAQDQSGGRVPHQLEISAGREAELLARRSEQARAWLRLGDSDRARRPFQRPDRAMQSVIRFHSRRNGRQKAR